MRLEKKTQRTNVINRVKLFLMLLFVLTIVFTIMTAMYYRDKYLAMQQHIKILKAQIEEQNYDSNAYAYLVDNTNNVNELASYVRELAYEVYLNKRPIALYLANLIVNNEGEYSDHPLDPGGETLYGISSKYHKFKPQSKEEAIEYLIRNYYYASNLDKLNSIRLSYVLFDSMVLFGDEFVKNKLIKILRVKTYNECIEIISDLTDIDSKTDIIIQNLKNELYNRINYLVANNTNLVVFKNGWLSRINKYR